MSAVAMSYSAHASGGWQAASMRLYAHLQALWLQDTPPELVNLHEALPCML